MAICRNCEKEWGRIPTKPNVKTEVCRCVIVRVSQDELLRLRTMARAARSPSVKYIDDGQDKMREQATAARLDLLNEIESVLDGIIGGL